MCGQLYAPPTLMCRCVVNFTHRPLWCVDVWSTLRTGHSNVKMCGQLYALVTLKCICAVSFTHRLIYRAHKIQATGSPKTFETVHQSRIPHFAQDTVLTSIAVWTSNNVTPNKRQQMPLGCKIGKDKYLPTSKLWNPYWNIWIHGLTKKHNMIDC